MTDQATIDPSKVTTTINLPAILQVRGIDAKMTGVSTQQWDDDFVAYMVAYAWGVRMQRCTASAKDHAKALREMFASMCDGETGNADGSRGPRQDPVTKAWVLYFNTQGVKVGGKAVSGNNLERAQEGMCREDILKMDPDALETIVEQVKTRFDGWKAYTEKTDPALVKLIAAEQAKANAKANPKAFVKPAAPKGSF
jgi:hypothetical protein